MALVYAYDAFDLLNANIYDLFDSADESLFVEDFPVEIDGTIYIDVFALAYWFDQSILFFAGSDFQEGFLGGPPSGTVELLARGYSETDISWAIADVAIPLGDIFAAGSTPDATDDQQLFASVLSGRDFFELSSFDDAVRGYGGNDTILGNGGNDTLMGDAGNDRIIGGSGNDSISTGTGNDYVAAGDGNDVVDASGGGFNRIWGGTGGDTITGGADNDTIGSGAGNDSVSSGAGDDKVWLGSGSDIAFGLHGNDAIGGGRDNDRIYGQDGNDSLSGAHGNDEIDGGDGDDVIWGGDGFDSLMGGTGNDSISSGGGTDWLYGNAGADAFIFFRNMGNDTIWDFDPTEGDSLHLFRGLWRAEFGDLTAEQVVTQFGGIDELGYVTLTLASAGTTITLAGYTDLAGLSDHILIF